MNIVSQECLDLETDCPYKVVLVNFVISSSNEGGVIVQQMRQLLKTQVDLQVSFVSWKANIALAGL